MPLLFYRQLKEFLKFYKETMENKIKIAVIGGTGKSGKYLLRELIHRGFQLKLLLRNPENFQNINPRIEIVKGDARDFHSIRTLIEGCQAVISTLGQPKGETSIFSYATKNVIRAMNEWNVIRYILTTGLNVDTPGDKKGPETKLATDWMKTNYPETTNDKQTEFDALFQSNVNWTLVRLVLVEQTDERKKVAVSLEDCPGGKISATDLAHFLVDQLNDVAYIRKAPFIANV
jgi:putative NADH-flavin reductase